MKPIFTGTYDQLKNKLSSINGEWDESQPNKKVLRLNGGVMNWFESTGTIQFQGKDGPLLELENKVLSLINPGHTPIVTPEYPAITERADQEESNVSNSESLGEDYLNGRFVNTYNPVLNTDALHAASRHSGRRLVPR